MIVERKGGRRVLVRYRDDSGKRHEYTIKDYHPFGFLHEDDAEFHERCLYKEAGYTGVFGEPLVKIVMSDPAEVGALKNDYLYTWECNIPFTNRALSEHNKDHGPFSNYDHRIWYWDMEWLPDNEEITIISVYDNFKDKMWTWAVRPDKPERAWSNFLRMGAEHPYNPGLIKDLDTVIQYFPNERDMLQHFAQHMKECDPDVITGWNVVNADCRVLIERMNKCGLDPKTLCGGSSSIIRYDFGDWQQPIGGRLVIDLMLAVSHLWQIKNGALPNKKLDTVAEIILKDRKLPLKNGHDTYFSDFETYVDYNIQDVELLPRLDKALNAINHYLAIQHIVQCDIQTAPYITRLFTVMAINDKDFHYCIPSKPMFSKVDYEGADIMQPIPGRYEGVAIMDIKAMYHSNVNLHNISWDTLSDDGKDCGNGSCFTQGDRGLLGRQMDKMTHLRNEYKALMKDAKTDDERARYDAMQFATKSLVASMYGAAGDSKYGLYHPKVAAAITYTSRQTLFRLRDECERLAMKVIYGHTDSVFVLCSTALKGCEDIKIINRNMAPIETEFEKWCSSMLIVAKNRYAGMTTWTDGKPHDPKLYVKGIELKQNRLPPVMKEVMSDCINDLLSFETEKTMTSKLQDIINDIVKGFIPKVDLCIKGRLKHNLENYSVLSEARAGAAWANKHLGKGYGKGSDFLAVIDSKGQYIAFDDPSDIEGIAEIGYKHMAEKFIVNKIKPYYEIVGFDMQPLYNSLNGVDAVEWL